jgi:hypothetical protein
VRCTRPLHLPEDYCAGGWPNEQALFAGQAHCRLVCGGILDDHCLVDQGSIVDARALALGEALQARQAMPTLRLDRDDSHRGVLLLEEFGRPDDGPARTQPGEEMRDLSRGLIPDLGPRGLVVSPDIVLVLVLVGHHVPVPRPLPLDEALRKGDRAVLGMLDRAEVVGRWPNFSAQQPQQRDLLGGRRRGDGDRAKLAAEVAEGGQRNAGVS